ncbi:MAG: hypothetical protein AAFX99_36460, partial [Myxococcota bacterium]
MRPAEEEGSWLEQVFAIVASPWLMAVGLMVLASMHLVKAISQLEPEGIFWVDHAPRAIVLAVLITSGLAAWMTRVLPVLMRRSNATTDAVVADVEVDGSAVVDVEALGLEDGVPSAFWGMGPALGSTLIMAALLAFAALPLVRSQGLVQGGTLALSAGRAAEAAQVDIGGLKVKQNLGGLRVELLEVQLGRFEASASPSQQPAAVRLRSKTIQTDQTVEAMVVEGRPTVVGSLEMRLARLAPTASAAGIRATIVDTQDNGRTFTLDLLLNQLMSDPAGPGTFRLTRIEPNMMGQLGLAAQGMVAEDGQSETPFWLYERAPQHDARHRKGRYRLTFVDVVPGSKAIVNVRPHEAPLDPLPILALVFVVGVGLLFSGSQLSLVRRGRVVRASSLNNGEALVHLLWGDDGVGSSPNTPKATDGSPPAVDERAEATDTGTKVKT